MIHRPTRKKRSSQKKSRKASAPHRKDYQKILLGLAILLGLVLIAAVAARLLLYPKLPPVPPPHPPAQTETAPPAPRPDTEKRTPPYEIYPDTDVPVQRRQPAADDTAVRPPPLAAIIIDDMGYDRRLARQFIELDGGITISIFPMSPHALEIMTMATARGIETMVHMPMEPEEYPQIDPGPGALLSTMSPDQLIEQLRVNLDALPSARGVNNHMGSRLTADADRMHQVFTVLKQRGLFFIDSRTTRYTVCRNAARLLQVPFSQRDVFLDHVQDAEFVRNQLALLIKTAATHGTALGIGHPYTVTYAVLKEMLPAIRKEVQLVRASRIVGVVPYTR